MAYVSREMKAEKLAKLKPIFKKYGVRASLAVRHHSALVLTIREGAIDFVGEYNATCAANSRFLVNGFDPVSGHFSVDRNKLDLRFSGASKEFLREVFDVLYQGYYNKSDIMSDYSDHAFYVNVQVGSWDKDYILRSSGEVVEAA